VVVSVVVLVISGAMWNFYRSFSTKITHINAVPASANTDGKDQNILLVGNDSRSGLSAAELKDVATQAEAGLNTDTMLLVHIPADGRQATAVSLPRDSWVDIPGVGMHKLNAAYANGACANGCGNQLTETQRSAGAQKLIQTVDGVSGLHIDHYVEVGLLGFYDITNELGGVQVCLKNAVKDHYSGIDLPAGVQTIKGTQALAFVRQRHGLPGGDLDRVRRQQAFLKAVADKVLTADTLLKPWKLKPLLDSVAKSLTVDKNFDPVSEIERLRELAAGNVKFETMPTEAGALINGQDALPLDKAKVRAFFAELAKGSGSGTAAGSKAATTPTVPPSSITVQVLNGGTIKGLAAKTNTALQQAGFQTTTPGNISSGDFSKPEIRYASGQAAAAHTLAGVVPGAVLKQDNTLGSTLHLIVGDSFGGVRTASYRVPVAHGGGTGMVAGGPITVAAPKSVAASGPACIN
jgi:LCP family protein required for cell wall assembly